MEHQAVLLTTFMVFGGVAIVATLALHLQQPLLVAYILVGVLFNQLGTKIIPDFNIIGQLDNIGSIFFMFLIGLQLKPQGLLRMLGKTTWITLTSSLIFFIVGFSIGYMYGYSLSENLIIGCCATFSSTLLGAKFLPPATGKHHYTGEVVLSILLVQDIIAALVLMFIGVTKNGNQQLLNIMFTLLAIPSMLALAIFIEKTVLKKSLVKFSHNREYIMLLMVAWCLGFAHLANLVGLPYEVGACIAGITLVNNNSIIHIRAQIQPIRDFFLIFFFFAIGSNFDFQNLEVIILPTILLVGILILLKPLVFRLLLRSISEVKHSAGDIGVWLGQLSEFSLFITLTARRSELISASVTNLIQNVTILMFIISSYLVVTTIKKQPVQTPEFSAPTENQNLS